MKTRAKAALLLSLLTCLLFTLSGCVHSFRESSPAALQVHLGSALPEDVVLTWDPDAVTVDSAEVTVTESGTVTVAIQLRRP